MCASEEERGRPGRDMCALEKRGEDQKENMCALEKRGEDQEESMCALEKRGRTRRKETAFFFQTQRETWVAPLYFLQLKKCRVIKAKLVAQLPRELFPTVSVTPTSCQTEQVFALGSLKTVYCSLWAGTIVKTPDFTPTISAPHWCTVLLWAGFLCPQVLTPNSRVLGQWAPLAWCGKLVSGSRSHNSQTSTFPERPALSQLWEFMFSLSDSPLPQSVPLTLLPIPSGPAQMPPPPVSPSDSLQS